MLKKKIRFMLDDGLDVLELEVKEDTDIAKVRKALKAECAPELDQFAAVKLKLYLTTDGKVAPGQPALNPTDSHTVITDGSIVVIWHPVFKNEGSEEICFRLWNGASVSIHRSRATSLQMLTNDVIEFLQLHSTSFKLYYIPGHNSIQFNSRVKLDEPSFFAYIQLPRPRPPVLVFVSKHENESPKDPCQDSQSDGASVSSSVKSEKRNDANQELFSKAVRDRDQCCLACGSIETETLQGAHVYPFEWRKELSKHAAHQEIGHVFETSNGVCLCVSCHSLFDRGYWCVRLGKFYVSEALEGSGAKVIGVNGRVFPAFLRRVEGATIPSEEARLFPGPRTWVAREAYFEQKRSDRHEVQNKAKAHCSKCCEPFSVDGKALKNHEMSCSGMTRKYFTPIKTKFALETKEESEQANKKQTKAKKG